MPSPTSNTRPTSLAPRPWRYSLISDWRTETISSALNLMAASFQELGAQVVDPGAHRAVELPVADAHQEAAEQVGVDPLVQDRVELKSVFELRPQPVAETVVQGHRGADQDADAAGLFIAQFAGR